MHMSVVDMLYCRLLQDFDSVLQEEKQKLLAESGGS